MLGYVVFVEVDVEVVVIVFRLRSYWRLLKDHHLDDTLPVVVVVAAVIAVAGKVA